MILEGTFTQFNQRNRNDRIYTSHQFLPHVNELLERKKQLGVVYGEMDHPDSFEMSLKYASHTIEDLSYNESKDCVDGKIKLLPTDYGRQAASIVEAGVPVFVSSRAAGVTESNGHVTIKKLFTYDMVGDPGFANTAMSRASMNEAMGYSPNANFRIYDMDKFAAINEYVNDRGGDGRAEQTTAAHFDEYKQYLEAQIIQMSEKMMRTISQRTASNEEISRLSEELEAMKEHNNKLQKYVEFVSGQAAKISQAVEGVDKRTSVIEQHSNVLADTLEKDVNYSNVLAKTINENTDLIQNTVNKEVKKLAESMNTLAATNHHNMQQIVEKIEVLKNFSNMSSKKTHGIGQYAEFIADKVDKLISYTEQLAAYTNNNTNYTESIAEMLNKDIAYTNFLGEKLEQDIAYTEFIGEKLDQSISYTETIGEELETSIKFTENTAMEVDKTQQYGQFLKEHLENNVTFMDFLGETIEKNIQFTEHVSEHLRNNIAYSTYLGKNLDVIEEALEDSLETQQSITEHTNYVIDKINKGKGLLNESGVVPVTLKTFEEFAANGASRDALVALASKIDDIRNQIHDLVDTDEEPTEMTPLATSPVEGDFADEDEMPTDPSTIADEIDSEVGDEDDVFPEEDNDFDDEEYAPKGDEDDEDDDGEEEDPFGDDFEDDEDDTDEAMVESNSFDEESDEEIADEFDDEFSDDDEAEVEEVEDAFAVENYVKVKADNKIGVVEKVLENNRYAVNVDGQINEYAAHELEAKNKKSQNFRQDITRMIAEIKKREASKNIDEPHFFEFLSEENKVAFMKLSPSVKEEIVAVAEQRTYYSEADVLAIIREVTTETNETFEQRLLRNMPSEIRPVWEKLTLAQKQEKINESGFFTLNDDHAMREFWISRRFEDKQDSGRKLITESLNDDKSVASPSDDSIDAFLQRFRGR